MAGYEFTAKTVEEAKKEGLAKLGIGEDQAEIVVIEETSGFLGVGKKARIRITKKASDGQRAVAFLDGLLSKMNVNATCELVEEGERIVINLIATNSSSLIGYRGEVLDSFQTLAGAVANTGREDYRRVVVDCEGYREKREETLRSLAQKLAEKAVRTGRKVTLEPMTPYERRIIHTALIDHPDVKTMSEGKEPGRYIAIIPNNLKPGYRDDRRGGDRGRFNRGSERDRGERFRPNGDRRGGGRDRGDRRGNFDRPQVKRIETAFGASTFLGNSKKEADEKPDTAPEE